MNAIVRLGPGGYPITAVGGQIVKVVGERLQLREVVSPLRGLIRSLVEGVRARETLLPGRGLFRSIVEGVRVSEATVTLRALVRSLVEAVSVGEGLDTARDIVRALSEALAAVETPLPLPVFVPPPPTLVCSKIEIGPAVAAEVVLVAGVTSKILASNPAITGGKAGIAARVDGATAIAPTVDGATVIHPATDAKITIKECPPELQV